MTCRAAITDKNVKYDKCFNNLNYNNRNNINTLSRAYHFYKTRCGQTDRPTDRQTDIATYRAAIAAKKSWTWSKVLSKKYWFCNKIFCMLELLYALFQLTTFVYTIFIESICMHYSKCQLLHALLQFKTTFVCTVTTESAFCSNIAIDNLSYTIIIIDFCMYYCNWQI